jgi:hypothetical protein
MNENEKLYVIDAPYLTGGTTVEKALYAFCRQFTHVLANEEGLLHILEQMTDFEHDYRAQHKGCKPVPVSLDKDRWEPFSFYYRIGSCHIAIHTIAGRCIR